LPADGCSAVNERNGDFGVTVFVGSTQAREIAPLISWTLFLAKKQGAFSKKHSVKTSQ
jgi:hypothetical protein